MKIILTGSLDNIGQLLQPYSSRVAMRAIHYRFCANISLGISKNI